MEIMGTRQWALHLQLCLWLLCSSFFFFGLIACVVNFINAFCFLLFGKWWVSILWNRRLNNNSLMGEIPRSLTNVNSLQVLWVLCWYLNFRKLNSFCSLNITKDYILQECEVYNAVWIVGIFQIINLQEIFRPMVPFHYSLQSGLL